MVSWLYVTLVTCNTLLRTADVGKLIMWLDVKK
jgi:hypothetical protein